MEVEREEGEREVIVKKLRYYARYSTIIIIFYCCEVKCKK